MAGFGETALDRNVRLGLFEDLDNWKEEHFGFVRCDGCDKIKNEAYFHAENELKCRDCIIEEIKSIISTIPLDISDYAILDRSLASARSLRWRFFFVLKFKEILESKPNFSFKLKVLLLQQLGYVAKHPLAWGVRQVAYELCEELGAEISPLLLKLYKRNPWQYQVNVTMLIGKIAPYAFKFPIMLRDALDSKNQQVKMRIVYLLKNIYDPRLREIDKIISLLIYDEDDEVRKFAIENLGEFIQSKKQAETEKQLTLTVVPDQPPKTILTLARKWRNKLNQDERLLIENVYENYKAKELTKIFSALLIPILKSQRLIDTDISIKKVPKKDLSQLFLCFLFDKDLFELLLQRMGAKAVSLLMKLVWEGGFYDMEDIQEEFDVKIFPAKVDFSRSYAKALVFDEFALFQFKINYDYHQHSYKPYLFLDNSIRSVFKKILPLPKEAQLKSIDKIPDDLYVYCDDNMFAEHAGLFLESLDQGIIRYSQNTGLPLKNSLKEWAKYLNIKEFFPEARRELQYLFSKSIINFLKDWERKESVPTNVVDVKEMVLNFFRFSKFEKYRFDNVLPHLKGGYYYMENVNVKIRKGFFRLLHEISSYDWLSLENLLYHLSCRDDIFDFSILQQMAQGFYINLPSSNYYSYRQFWIDNDMFLDLFFYPLIKGALFLFAALGLVDIAYQSPVNDLFQRRNKEYLSEYDGLKFVRLNSFGKFVLGLNKEYEVKEETPTKVIPDEKRLLLTIEGTGKLEQLIVNQLAEKITDSHYKISYQSFLKNCYSSEDVRENIRKFKKVIASDLPPVWKEFFADIQNKINPLQINEEFQVFKIKPSRELISIVARDEMLKKHILKVEDFHIAVKRQNVKKVIKRLREYGFFIDQGVLSADSQY